MIEGIIVGSVISVALIAIVVHVRKLLKKGGCYYCLQGDKGTRLAKKLGKAMRQE